MSYQYFEKHPEARTIQQLINNLDEEIEENYFAKMTGSMNLKSHGILILNDDDLSRVLVKVRPKRLYLLNVDLETKTFTVYGLPNDDDENTFSLTDFVSSLRSVAFGNAPKNDWEDDFDLSYDADFDDDDEDDAGEIDDDDIEIEDDDDDEDAGDFEDGIDDIFEMELAEIDDAQCSLRLDVRKQLRLYPNVKINDRDDGVLVTEDEEWEYINQEVQLEGRNFEDLDDPFTPFDVPIKFFGNKFTLRFSPYHITVWRRNQMLNIPSSSEYHIIFNAMLEFLSYKAEKVARVWRKQQVLARLERK